MLNHANLETDRRKGDSSSERVAFVQPQMSRFYKKQLEHNHSHASNFSPHAVGITEWARHGLIGEKWRTRFATSNIFTAIAIPHGCFNL